MANEITRRTRAVRSKGKARGGATRGSVSRKPAKKGTKPASKKQKGNANGVRVIYAADHGLMTAFHHMQRASVVMSLMEKGTGEDLRGLLDRGVRLYRAAMKNDASKFVLRAIGVLRAAEHLSMAGLYEARKKYKQAAVSPTPEWLAKVINATDQRLEQIEHAERGKGADLFPVTVELLRQAENPKLDAHLAFELAMAADALCFALENGL